MQDIEPYYNWRHIYEAETDEYSPFFGKEYNEFEFTQTVYNYFIHPQWDDFGSKTLYLKVLYVSYEYNVAIIELIGEWNDAIENDIMLLRREVTDDMYAKGIYKFLLIGEAVLNFHSSDDSYYEEWNEQVIDNNGWVVMLNLPEQSQYDFKKSGISRYVQLMEVPQWRTFLPEFLFQLIDADMGKRLL